MAGFPLSLDDLIAYVKELHPEGGELEHLNDAVTVAARVDEQADALIGHFVDRARASGASWSEIGAAMGVSKQAAQKRFVSRDESPGPKAFSRFTPRARGALAAAVRLAAAAGASEVDVTHVVSGLLAEPRGIAAMALHRLGATDEQLLSALGVGPSTSTGDADTTELLELRYTATCTAALAASLHAALRLRHNYIGTEHLLLGVVSSDNEAARRLSEIGYGAELVDRAVAVAFAEVRLELERKGL